jgi:hypothetical protein
MDMKREPMGKDLGQAFERLCEVPPLDEEQQAVKRLAFVNQVRRHRQILSTMDRAGRGKTGRFRPLRFLNSRKMALAGALLALLLVVIAGTGGVIYAADRSVPGDPLYGIDQTVESVRLSLTTRPEATTRLLLSLAKERLAEAEELSTRGDGENLDVALSGLGTVVSSLVEAQNTGDGEGQAAVAALLDNSFSSQEGQTEGSPRAIVAEDVDDDEQGEPEQDGVNPCTQADPHPVAERLAESYEVPYEDIMTWFCDGNYGMGEIMLALKTGEKMDVPAADLLERKTELGGWGKVWQELGLIGRPGTAMADPSEEVGDEPPAQTADEPPAPDEEQDFCVGADPHPVADRLAELYGVPYEDIMDWFCNGKYGMGEIKLALQTSLETDYTPEELLAMKTELGGWGKVWQELELIGRPRHELGGPTKDEPSVPAGEKPEAVSKGKPGGPPQDKPGKPLKDKPAKPAKANPGGSPNGKPSNKP